MLASLWPVRAAVFSRPVPRLRAGRRSDFSRPALLRSRPRRHGRHVVSRAVRSGRIDRDRMRKRIVPGWGTTMKGAVTRATPNRRGRHTRGFASALRVFVPFAARVSVLRPTTDKNPSMSLCSVPGAFFSGLGGSQPIPWGFGLTTDLPVRVGRRGGRAGFQGRIRRRTAYLPEAPSRRRPPRVRTWRACRPR